MTDKITQEELLRLLQEGMVSGEYDPNHIFSEVRKARALRCHIAIKHGPSKRKKREQLLAVKRLRQRILESFGDV